MVTMKRSTKLFLFGIGVALGLSTREILKQLNKATQAVGPYVFERLGKDASVGELTAELEAAGKRNLQQLMEKMPTERNYRLLVHLIGIEKWGQRRLRVTLGDPVISDEHDAYCPPFGLSWNELQDIFNQTRLETLDLARFIEEAGVSGTRIFHNEFGKITASHWLNYLRLHANLELWKMN
ncbi:MAG: hypothetical protein ACI9EW_001973 [Cellvibrionaceae bacterium]|jgi:hypothetical protein